MSLSSSSAAAASCAEIPLQNEDRYESFSMLSAEGHPIVCGNYPGDGIRNCEKFDPESKTWTLLPNEMLEQRSLSAATLINHGQEYWITGKHVV